MSSGNNHNNNIPPHHPHPNNQNNNMNQNYINQNGGNHLNGSRCSSSSSINSNLPPGQIPNAQAAAPAQAGPNNDVAFLEAIRARSRAYFHVDMRKAIELAKEDTKSFLRRELADHQVKQERNLRDFWEKLMNDIANQRAQSERAQKELWTRLTTEVAGEQVELVFTKMTSKLESANEEIFDRAIEDPMMLQLGSMAASVYEKQRQETQKLHQQQQQHQQYIQEQRLRQQSLQQQQQQQQIQQIAEQLQQSGSYPPSSRVVQSHNHALPTGNPPQYQQPQNQQPLTPYQQQLMAQKRQQIQQQQFQQQCVQASLTAIPITANIGINSGALPNCASNAQFAPNVCVSNLQHQHQLQQQQQPFHNSAQNVSNARQSLRNVVHRQQRQQQQQQISPNSGLQHQGQQAFLNSQNSEVAAMTVTVMESLIRQSQTNTHSRRSSGGSGGSNSRGHSPGASSGYSSATTQASTSAHLVNLPSPKNFAPANASPKENNNRQTSGENAGISQQTQISSPNLEALLSSGPSHNIIIQSTTGNHYLQQANNKQQHTIQGGDSLLSNSISSPTTSVPLNLLEQMSSSAGTSSSISSSTQTQFRKAPDGQNINRQNSVPSQIGSTRRLSGKRALSVEEVVPSISDIVYEPISPSLTPTPTGSSISSGTPLSSEVAASLAAAGVSIIVTDPNLSQQLQTMIDQPVANPTTQLTEEAGVPAPEAMETSAEEGVVGQVVENEGEKATENEAATAEANSSAGSLERAMEIDLPLPPPPSAQEEGEKEVDNQNSTVTSSNKDVELQTSSNVEQTCASANETTVTAEAAVESQPESQSQDAIAYSDISSAEATSPQRPVASESIPPPSLAAEQPAQSQETESSLNSTTTNSSSTETVPPAAPVSAEATQPVQPTQPSTSTPAPETTVRNTTKASTSASTSNLHTFNANEKVSIKREEEEDEVTFISFVKKKEGPVTFPGVPSEDTKPSAAQLAQAATSSSAIKKEDVKSADIKGDIKVKKKEEESSIVRTNAPCSSGTSRSSTATPSATCKATAVVRPTGSAQKRPLPANAPVVVNFSAVHYECAEPTCRRMIPRSELFNHQRTEHNIKKFICYASGCQPRVSFDRKIELTAHVNTVHQNTTWVCHHCNEVEQGRTPRVRNNYDEHEKHVRFFHVRGEFKCNYPDCNFSSDLLSDVGSHSSAVHSGSSSASINSSSGSGSDRPPSGASDSRAEAMRPRRE